MSEPSEDLEAWVRAAQDGSAEALDALVAALRHRVYRIALRMVTRPADAEDATQEILVRVVTRLGTYRHEARFTTWVYRVAMRHLVDRRRTCAESANLSFEGFADDLAAGLGAAPDDPEREAQAREVRLGCTLAVLTCLDRHHRVAYVAGEILGLSSPEGAYVCDVSEAAYRKRLSRARERVHGFLEAHCGLVSPEGSACRCERRIDAAKGLGRLDPANLVYAHHAVERATEELVDLHDAAALMRAHPDYAAPEKVTESLAALLRSGKLTVLAP